jgi:hypothetical protein
VIVGYALMRDESSGPPNCSPARQYAEVRDPRRGAGYVRRTDLVLMATIVGRLASTFGMNFG